MLDHLRTPPRGGEDGAPVLVLLHGRGSHMGDLQGLAALLPPGGVLLTPQAPHPGAPWGYGPGWAWYRYLGDDRVESASLTASLEELDAFLGQLPETLGFQPGPLVLGGFSQGGTTSLAYGITNPGRAAALVNLSGFMVREEAVGSELEALGDTPIFWGHGTQDPSVPFSLAVKGRERLRRAGARVLARDYPMGHAISPDEAKELREWLGERVPGWMGAERRAG